MARDAHAIALSAFAQTHEPLPEFPVLPPAPVALALPSMASAPEVLDDVAPVLALCPAAVPIPFSSFLAHNDSIRTWLTSALPLVVDSAPDKTPALQTVSVSPVVTAANSRKPKTTSRMAAAG
jgi:hypothetical protein